MNRIAIERFGVISANMFSGREDSAFQDIVRLRKTCWQASLVNLDALDDGHDAHAFHYVVFEDGSLVAAARFCAHRCVSKVPDAHLYHGLDTRRFCPRYGCLNRLVIDVAHRGRGFSGILDFARETFAQNIDCKTMLGAWNAHTSENRRRQLLDRGYESVSDNQPVVDGEFGYSYPFARTLATLTSAPIASEGRKLAESLRAQGAHLRLPPNAVCSE